MRRLLTLLIGLSFLATAKATPVDCSRTYTLALHDHGLLYSADTDTGIDKDVADELIRRSGCKVVVSLMQRARIWQLIESGALDFSLYGIANAQRDTFAGFAWYFSNKYYLLARNRLRASRRTTNCSWGSSAASGTASRPTSWSTNCKTPTGSARLVDSHRCTRPFCKAPYTA